MTTKRGKAQHGKSSQTDSDENEGISAKQTRPRAQIRRIDRFGTEIGLSDGVINTLEQLQMKLREEVVKAIKPKRQSVSLSDSEVLAVCRLLHALFATESNDSSRRKARDESVALDYILHKEILSHRSVMDGVCARWDLSESAVKQAVRRAGDGARLMLKAYKKSDEMFAAARQDSEDDEPLEIWLARDLREEAKLHREGAIARPRKPRRR